MTLCVLSSRQRLLLVVNEDGKVLDPPLAFNAATTDLYRRFKQAEDNTIVGNAVLATFPDEID